MASKGTLHLSTSNSSGIPDQIYRAILEMKAEFIGNWNVSLLSCQSNDKWVLKLTPEHGKERTYDLYPEHQDVIGVQGAMKILRDAAVTDVIGF
jgi:hypothetical protein